ncbi:hypothetical protein [Fredinandcohnia onubensis]|uniref:hypothetical protein n=1 Tax=Fredinandcohnia onubensis TaxID=1571209 RepID=UPI0015D4F72B|nr:hypothetical protein [Fredinandcohnia onubensis]
MKWKNYGLWVSLGSILYMVFKDLGMQIDLTAWETYVTAILGLLGALGIISNPDKGKGFFDKIPNTPVEAIAQVTEQLQNQPPNGNDGNLPQNHIQNPTNLQQNQSYTSKQTMGNTPQQQPQNQMEPVQSQYQVNQFQNEYQDYENQTNHTQQFQPHQEYQNQSNVNNATYTQELEPAQVQSEVNIDSNKYAEVSSQKQTPSNFDRSSIHGMPAPPNEHM